MLGRYYYHEKQYDDVNINHGFVVSSMRAQLLMNQLEEERYRVYVCLYVSLITEVVYLITHSIHPYPSIYPPITSIH